MNAFTHFNAETDAAPMTDIAIGAVPAILEWLDLAEPQIALDLAISTLGMTAAYGSRRCTLSLEQFTADGSCVEDALRNWCSDVLQGFMHNVDPLNAFIHTYAPESRKRFEWLVAAAARYFGEITCDAQQTHVALMGVYGQGTTLAAATDRWRDMAIMTNAERHGISIAA